MATILVLSFGLTSLAVGLGAMTPNFREDNPARIANGLGGTLNVVLSLIYVGAVLGLEAGLYLRHHAVRTLALDAHGPVLAACWGALVVLNVAAIVVPMWLGLRQWRRMEF